MLIEPQTGYGRAILESFLGPSMNTDLRLDAANTLRFLAADAVQQANSGHPGAPMGQADIALTLWDEVLRFDAQDPAWPGRDRFVLSCGHASMLLYSLLHVWGFDVSLDDLKDFRQWGSKTPGHPEVGHTPGVEMTTGPLGQGVATSVGMALAAKMLSARLATDSFDPMAQRVFTLCSDGDLMEGVSSEAASLAGHWQLDNLVWLYDDNKITIDGATDAAFREDIPQRFESMGWMVLHADGHDAGELSTALKLATDADKPVLVVCRTHIGWGSPNKVDTSGVHGSPLGDAELALTRAALGWPDERFFVPSDVAGWFYERGQKKRAERLEWDAKLAAWRTEAPEKAALYDRLLSGGTEVDLYKALVAAAPDGQATRKISQAVLNEAIAQLPGLVGGSADLIGSNGLKIPNTVAVGHPDVQASIPFSFEGRQIYFGIREHAMGAITNGMLLHGGLRPFSGTFLVFSDYVRPAMRLAALSNLPNIFVFTHDSIFLGEDGPTHQPVEHHWALRPMVNLSYWRPADGLEVAMAWAWALAQTSQPTAFAFTRQSLPKIERGEGFDPRTVWKGGYVVSDAADPELILLGTGSELHLCTGAAAQLAAEGHRVRVVSMPSVSVFEGQSAAYQAEVLPDGVPVITVEAGITGPWKAFTGRTGANIGLDRYGASAPAKVLAEKFGLTEAAVADRARALLG